MKMAHSACWSDCPPQWVDSSGRVIVLAQMAEQRKQRAAATASNVERFITVSTDEAAKTLERSKVEAVQLADRVAAKEVRVMRQACAELNI